MEKDCAWSIHTESKDSFLKIEVEGPALRRRKTEGITPPKRPPKTQSPNRRSFFTPATGSAFLGLGSDNSPKPLSTITSPKATCVGKIYVMVQGDCLGLGFRAIVPLK